VNLGKAFSAMAMVTVLSRLSGFLRVAVFAAYFGSGSAADIFLSIMMIPEIMYRFGADGLISSVAVPMFVSLREKPDETRAAFRSLIWGIICLAVPVVVLTVILAPQLCDVMVPGFSADLKTEMSFLLRFVAPYILFSLLASLQTAFLNAHGSFGLPTFGPILVNAAVIAGIVLSSGRDIRIVTLSVTLGAVIQVLWLAFPAAHYGADLRMPVVSPFRCAYFRDFLQKTGPISVWIFLSPIVPLFERYLLSSQPQGSVALLNYCEKLLYFPLGILSISLSAAVFPLFSGRTAEENREPLYSGLWSIVALLLPLTMVFFLCAQPIVSAIFRRGAFHGGDVELTGNLLQIYALALLGMTGAMFLNRFFFSQRHFRLPLLAGLIQITVQIAADQMLVQKLGPVGLAWGAVIATFIQLLLLLTGLAWIVPFSSRLQVFLPVAASLVPLGLLPWLQGPIGGLLHEGAGVGLLVRPALFGVLLQGFALLTTWRHIRVFFRGRYIG
jgi:putative peptidoglycan lipid II flippase